jgi:hypothetical protein
MITDDYASLLQLHIICILVFPIGTTANVQHPEWSN